MTRRMHDILDALFLGMLFAFSFAITLVWIIMALDLVGIVEFNIWYQSELVDVE